MVLEIENIELKDNCDTTNGVSFMGETLSDFLEFSDSQTLTDINKDLAKCGIEPITLDQIKVVGVKGK